VPVTVMLPQVMVTGYCPAASPDFTVAMPPVALESIESATLPVNASDVAVPVEAEQLIPYTDTLLPGAAVLGWRSTG